MRTVAPQVDERIDAWLARMLAKQPEDRFRRAEGWVELEDIVLDLLGPRWRREARLIVAGQTPPGDRRGAGVPAPSVKDSPESRLESIPRYPRPSRACRTSGSAAPEDTVAPSTPRRRRRHD